ncbi:hypothetical protein ANN_14225 [Periplaneta americana]|uniref:Uncharacterized protein n=1 Tax=Periplaneta americana TaxID=6978 RepID=A0ABQ8SX30_PERAM|nr:hypothetical protein ANN_14225 [Periplaneta americana]
MLIMNLHLEQQLSLRRLNINKSSIAPNTKGRQLREILRNRSFESWCKLPHKGKGVILYSDYPKANSWMSSKANLSISEYINAIKISSNLSAVRSVPGRSLNTTRCRHPGCNETETLGHVLGFCRKTELLRNNRHHKARTDIADVLKRRGWEVYEEIHCVSSLDSNRRADIVAIHGTQSKGLVLDPTIRFERDALKAQQVDEEKKSIYESCIPYLSEKCNIPTKFNEDSIVGTTDNKKTANHNTLLPSSVMLRCYNNTFEDSCILHSPNAGWRRTDGAARDEWRCLFITWISSEPHCSQLVVVIIEDVQNVHLLLEYRPHIDVSLTCEHDPKLQEYCVCPHNMPQFDSEGIPNHTPETNKPMILNGPTSRNREGSDQVSVEAKQLGHLYLSIDQETFDPSTGEPYD